MIIKKQHRKLFLHALEGKNTSIGIVAPVPPFRLPSPVIQKAVPNQVSSMFELVVKASKIIQNFVRRFHSLHFSTIHCHNIRAGNSEERFLPKIQGKNIEYNMDLKL